MEETYHSETDHFVYIERLCRICGLRTQTSVQRNLGKKPRKVAHHAHTILKLFHIDVANDTKIHSTSICQSCYNRLKNFETRPVTEKTLKSAQDVKSVDFWIDFDEKLTITECPLCSHYLSLGNPGRKRKLNTPQLESTVEETSLEEPTLPLDQTPCSSTASTSLTTVPSALQISCDQPLLTSTPKKSRRKLILETYPGSASKLHTASTSKTFHTSTLMVDSTTSPMKGLSSPYTTLTDSSTSPVKPQTRLSHNQSNTPLTDEEEQLASHLIRRMLAQSENRNILRIKTRGQPIIFQRIPRPRKTSDKASSPTKRKRTKQISSIRSIMSGRKTEAVEAQEERDIRNITSERAKNIIRISKKWRTRKTISKTYAFAIKSKLGMSWDKFRDLTRMLRSHQVRIENEKAQRSFQLNILPKDLITETHVFAFRDNRKAECFRPTPAIFIDNFQTYLFHLLDQYESQSKLSWHGGKIPHNEIWVKIGGDHGQGSLKITLQTLNIEKPNSKFHTSVIAMAHVPDNVHNLQTLMDRLSDKINALKTATWKDRKICVFLCGDYHFLADIHGISGSSGTHPCLWCLQTKKETQIPRDPECLPKPRTNQNMKDDYTLFSTAGKLNLSQAKQFNNVIRSPMLPLSVTHTAVPYLHILLGVVKKHHQLLEQHCDTIDKQVAADMADLDLCADNLSSDFRDYVHFLRKIEQLEERKRLQETKLVFLEESLSVIQFYKRTRQLEKKIEKLEDKIDRMTNTAKPYVSRCGPVCSNLDTILKSHKITIQAYHGRSFTGNHSQKYIQPSINKTICSSILSQARNYTKQQKIIDYADQVRKTFHHANTLYFNIHKAISHCRPIDNNEIETIQQMIDEYMKFYRDNTSHTIFPKLNFLEHHCNQWIRRWGFGMGLHGEQGVELVHSSIKKLENQSLGTKREEDRLKIVMKSHQAQVSPTLHSLHPSSKRQMTK